MKMRTRRITRLTGSVALILIAACTWMKTGTSGGQTGLILTATTAKTTYNTSEPIRIALTLVNNTGASVTLSPMIDGNVRIVSMTHDGAPVSPVAEVVRYDDDLGAVLRNSLRSNAAGQSLVLDAWTSTFAVQSGDRALKIVTYDAAGHHTAQVYPVRSAGNYALTVVYQYAGLQSATGAAYAAASTTVQVMFTVTP